MSDLNKAEKEAGERLQNIIRGLRRDSQKARLCRGTRYGMSLLMHELEVVLKCDESGFHKDLEEEFLFLDEYRAN